MLARLRERVLDRALHLPSATLERAGTGDLVARAGDDVAVVTNVIATSGPAFLGALLSVVLTAAGLFALDWRLGIAGLAAAPAYAVALRWYLKRSVPYYARERVATGERAQATAEALRGAATVRAYRMEDAHVARIAERSGVARDLSLEIFGLYTRFGLRINRSEFVGLAAVLLAGFLLVRGDLATVGAATTAALYFHRLFNPIGLLLFESDSVLQAGASLARLVGVTTLPDTATPAGAEPNRHDRGVPAALEVTVGQHRYDDGPVVLRDIPCVSPPGSASPWSARAARARAPSPAHRRHHRAHRRRGDPARRAADTARRAPPPSRDRPDQPGGARLRRAARRRPAAGAARTPPTPNRAPPSTRRRPGWAGPARRPRHGRGRGWAPAHPGPGPAARAGPPGPRRSGRRVLDEATAEAGSAGARDLDRAAVAATEGRTALIVAHRLSQAATADRIVVLDEGRVAETARTPNCSGPRAGTASCGARGACPTPWSRENARARTSPPGAERPRFPSPRTSARSVERGNLGNFSGPAGDHQSARPTGGVPTTASRHGGAPVAHRTVVCAERRR